MIAPDLLETTVFAAPGAARRLTTVEKVKADMGVTDSTNDGLIEQYIDQVSDAAARHANLAEDGAGNFPTFGAETLRATWYAYAHDPNLRGNLLLPWRVKWAVTGITEAGTALVAGTDYRVLPGGELKRLNHGYPWAWHHFGDIVVTFTAGWALPDDVPPALEARVIEQLKAVYVGRTRDPALRSFSVPDTFQASFSVPGGDSIGSDGLLTSLESALDPYTRQAI